MTLGQLLAGCEYTLMTGSCDTEVESISYHTRWVSRGSLFVCIDGTVADGNVYVEEAVEKGAVVIVTTKELEWDHYEGVTFVKVPDSRKALAKISANYFGNPARQLRVIGITGTKGKTTTSYMIRQMLELSGIKTALIGTIETIIGEERKSSINTTPESYMVQKTLRRAVDAGCQCVVMEVSSQGLKLARVDGIIFDYAVFMNLGQDHIGANEHKDFEEYRECKGRLFEQCKTGIFNVDDDAAEYMMNRCSGAVETFAVNKEAKHRALNCSLYRNGYLLGSTFDLTGWYDTHIILGIPGLFNVYNALAAIAVASHFGVKESVINYALSNIRVKGRVEIVPIRAEYTLMIDYAHNAMSLESVLKTVKEYEPGCLISMFGCGGNRDKNRRYEMGEISAKLSDVTVVTSDNPRYEEPRDIMNDIVAGVKRVSECTYVTIENRKEAIRYCMKHAEPGDIVVLAGKGHETYQEIKGIKYPMDERDLIQDICQEEGITIYH